MKVWVSGAGGFVGRHIVAALEKQGCAVIKGVSRLRGQANEVVENFAQDVTPQAWLPRLEGVDAVVNAVGVLRNSRRRPMQAVHVDAPKALFDACEAAGVRKLVHVSALGIASSANVYATSKRQAEADLLQRIEARRLQATVVRPSVVFGAGGESSELFLNLARLPLLVLPRIASQTQVQPIHVTELAQAIACLLTEDGTMQNRPALEAVGPQAITLDGLIASLRQQMGRPAAKLLLLPDALTRLSARAGDLIPVSPWGSEALALLSHDNVGQVGDVRQLLGRMPCHYSQLLHVGKASA